MLSSEFERKACTSTVLFWSLGIEGYLNSAVAVPAATVLASVGSYATIGDGATAAVFVNKVKAL